LCVTLVIYQESLHDARSTKYKMDTDVSEETKTSVLCADVFCNDRGSRMVRKVGRRLRH